MQTRDATRDAAPFPFLAIVFWSGLIEDAILSFLGRRHTISVRARLVEKRKISTSERGNHFANYNIILYTPFLLFLFFFFLFYTAIPSLLSLSLTPFLVFTRGLYFRIDHARVIVSNVSFFSTRYRSRAMCVGNFARGFPRFLEEFRLGRNRYGNKSLRQDARNFVQSTFRIDVRIFPQHVLPSVFIRSFYFSFSYHFSSVGIRIHTNCPNLTFFFFVPKEREKV